MDKRGQISFFVIGAIIIVGIVASLFLFPQTRSFIAGGDINPNSFLRDCIEPELERNIEILSNQGGYLIPENYVLYKNNKIPYLCYTSEPYKTCQVQQPLIKNNYESELKKAVEPVARQCLTNLIEDYEGRGYEVSAQQGDLNLSIVPGKIIVEFLSPLTLSRESVQTYTKFGMEIPSAMYDLLLTATSIINYEASLGDSETLLYIQYFPDLKIDKIKREEGTIYILNNIVTEESFSFASRSLEWPPGYGTEEVL